MVRIKYLALALVLIFAAAPMVLAQDMQTRPIFHPTLDLNNHWFLAGWVIGNAKFESTNNINLFAGVGFRQPRWWLEGMVQRQWSKAGNQVLLDFRFQK